MIATSPPIALCSRCAITQQAKPSKDGSPKLPRGWRRIHEQLVCGGCVHGGYITRAASVRIRSATDEDGNEIAYADLRTLIRQSCRDAASAANLTIQQLLRREIVRVPSMTKLGAIPAPPPSPTGAKSTAGYHEIRAALPELDPHSVTSIVQAVDRKWRASRLDVVWRRAAAPPAFRDDMPCPFSAASVRVESRPEEPGQTRSPVVVSLRLRGRRVLLHLWRGGEFERHLDPLRRVASGEFECGEAALFLRGNGQCWFKVAYIRPKQYGPRETDGVLMVSTGGDRMLTMTLGDQPRFINADKQRRDAAEHVRRLQRWSEDLKPETRPPAGRAKLISQDRAAACARRHGRVDAHTHELSAQVACFARRRRVAKVIYDDTDRSYIESYPWRQLKERIAAKCDAFGIAFEAVASATVADGSEGALADGAGQ